MIYKNAKISAGVFDVCIVGAGPAGIALALKLGKAGKQVVLLESGLEEITENQEALNSLATNKMSIGKRSRARALGGTTKLWSGRWKTLDTVDFTARSWVPASGWPFAKESLEPFYSEAATFLEAPSAEAITQLTFSARTKELCANHELEPTILWTISPSAFDVGKRFRKELSENQNIAVYLGTTATGIESDGHKVTGVQISLEHGKGMVTATSYVLASGGIENARLLLASKLGGPATGKYFMDHPKGTLATITLKDPRAFEKEWLSVREASGTYRIGFRLPDAVQAEKRLLNPYVQLEPIYKSGFLYKILRKLGMRVPLKHIAVGSYFEMAPREENALTLLEETDAFGIPRAQLSYELGALDMQSMKELHALLKERVETLAMGTLQSDLLEGGTFTTSKIRDASHHMGTTRMGTNSATSVVDTNAKVHDIENLYIVGSSVFPTGGHANPTATLVALSLRLGHHLLHA